MGEVVFFVRGVSREVPGLADDGSGQSLELS